MEKNPKLSVGRKSRAQVCPVCMRSKVEAIVEQLKTGTSCGDVKCKFKTEIDLMFMILNAPNIEQLQSVTAESIDGNNKIYELLFGIRETLKTLNDRMESSKKQDEIQNLSVDTPKTDLEERIQKHINNAFDHIRQKMKRN
jgi:hypothetical protein